MSEPESLQFDRVEVEAGSSSATICPVCRQAIVQSYYEVNGSLICSRCHELRMQGMDGSKSMRIGRALVAGFGAAIAGAIVWWGVRTLTGYEIGLISIGIGIGVGKAVRWGSRNRGGWAYQLIAVLLTYAAVAGNYTPDVIQAFRDKADEETKQQTTAKVATQPSTTATAKPKVVKAGMTSKADESVGLGTIALGLLAIFAIAAAAPFMSGANSIIGLLIIAFGLFEAWKINKRVPLTVNGPFSVAPVAPPPNV